MRGKNLVKKNSTIKIEILKNTKQLCRVLNHKGTLEILYSLHERPKQFNELFSEMDLPSSTFQDAISNLNKSTFVIKKNPITSKNRETHQYTLTKNGQELLGFIQNYEKIIKIPSSQQKISEIKTKSN